MRPSITRQRVFQKPPEEASPAALEAPQQRARAARRLQMRFVTAMLLDSTANVLGRREDACDLTASLLAAARR